MSSSYLSLVSRDYNYNASIERFFYSFDYVGNLTKHFDKKEDKISFLDVIFYLASSLNPYKLMEGLLEAINF